MYFLAVLVSFVLCLGFTVDQTSEEGLLASLALIIRAPLHGVLLWLFKERIIWVTETLIFENPLTLSLFEG